LGFIYELGKHPLVQNAQKMLSGRRRNSFKTGTALAALAAGLLAAFPSYAQDAPPAPAPAETPAAPGATGERAQGELSAFTASLIPGFTLDAQVNLSETYTTNASGTSSLGNQDDWVTQAGIRLDTHEHSRRVSVDASYYGQVFYYAKDSQSTQFTNDLQLLGTVIAIPDYLNFVGRAFAQPVVISNSAFSTGNGIVSPDGYRNSYGYSIGPDITFKLGDFASSDTLATYGGAYFTNPNGINSAVLIPGVSGPENTTMRSVNETLKSGPDFTRLQWTAVALFNETDRAQGLFAEKTGMVTLQYAINHEFALLGTGGYDKISNTTPLTKDVSGPIGMAGVLVTFGEDFMFEIQAGEKYNSMSYEGLLRWNITPTSTVTGSATDSVSTPEGQLMNNLSSLTSSLNGTLTTDSALYGNGQAASLAAFSAQSLGSLSFNQNIARYQRVNFTYAFDFERDHANVMVFGDKQTQLNGFFLGPPITTSWGGRGSYSHDITREITGTVGAGYTYYDELGGHSKQYDVDGQVSYRLGPLTSVYFRADYLRRDSSQSLQSLSPFTGSLDDIRLMLGLTRQL
jgi:uncharacterized protein (PEP-CTERM system associated)